MSPSSAPGDEALWRRRRPWLDQQMEAARSESERLRALDLRPPLRGRAWPGAALLLVTAALVVWKNVLIAGSPDAIGGPGPWVRNGVAMGAVAVLIVVALRRRDWLVAAGAPRQGPIGAWMVGVGALGLAVMAVVASDRPGWAWILIGVTILVLAGLWRYAADSPSETVAWSVIPASLVALVVAVARLFRAGPHLDLLLLGTVALGTGILEEVVFRGGLYALALRTRDRTIRLLVPGVAFGAWHVMDAVADTRGLGWAPWAHVLFVIGTVVATTLASWLVLEPLRLRCRSVVGPALLHGAVNSGLIALGLRL